MFLVFFSLQNKFSNNPLTSVLMFLSTIIQWANSSKISLFVIKVEYLNFFLNADNKGKDKGHPITGHEGPEGEQMYSSTLPSTSALDGGGWATPLPSRFTPG